MVVLAAGGTLVLQMGGLVMAGTERWTPLRWTRYWMQVEVPEPLRASPYLYLSMDLQPAAAMAMFLHPGSGLINLRGQHALDLDGPGGERVRRLLQRYEGRLRTLMLNHHRIDSEIEWVKVVDTMYGRFGLRIDADDCLFFRYVERTDDAWSEAANRMIGHTKRLNPYPLLSCGLRPAPVSPDYQRERPRVDAVFAAIERACPRLYTPGLARSEQIGASWSRFYATTDRALVLEDGWVFGRQSKLEWLTFGRAVDWEGGKAPPALPRDCATRSAAPRPD